MASITCPHCGTANRSGSNYCNRCGAMLREVATPLPSEEPSPVAPQQPAPAPGPVAPPAQPWLQPGFIGEGDVPLDDDEETLVPTEALPAAARLVSGVQGLLDPIRVAVAPGEGGPEAVATTAVMLDPDRLRRLRTLMAEEPVLASLSASTPALPANLRIPWVFLLIGLAVALPVFLQLMRPGGLPRQWPGVAEAFATIDTLPPQAAVQVLWAYDPAAAGELDLVAAPVVRHLLEHGARTTIYSLLPNGPATARRLYASVQDERGSQRTYTPDPAPVEARFLPGGTAVLAALGEQEATLAIVIAAQAEDVQAWLELVAPANRTPVVAVTSAGADPVLRPYLESSQLTGLVSGFDGAASYTNLMADRPTRTREASMNVQIAAQNTAMWALLALLIAGNLVALLVGRRNDG